MAHGDVTRLLNRDRQGDRLAEEELFARVQAELHRIARACFRRERPGHVLQSTALINEAYMRLVGQRAKEWSDRTHFFAVSAKIMRRILVDAARHAHAEKRGSGLASESLNESLAGPAESPELTIALNDALTRLEAIDARQAKVVELRYFAGMSIEETAVCLHVSTRTVRREWTMARAWLRGELTSSRSKAILRRRHHPWICHRDNESRTSSSPRSTCRLTVEMRSSLKSAAWSRRCTSKWLV